MRGKRKGRRQKEKEEEIQSLDPIFKACGRGGCLSKSHFETDDPFEPQFFLSGPSLGLVRAFGALCSRIVNHVRNEQHGSEGPVGGSLMEGWRQHLHLHVGKSA